MRPSTTLLLAATLLAAGACASAGTSAADGSARPSRSTSSTNALSAADITGATQRDLRDVVRALRPRWLQNTSAGSLSSGGANAAVAVYVNGRPQGGLESLSGIDKGSVERVLYYTVSEAQGRYGSTVSGPVIDVQLKSGG